MKSLFSLFILFASTQLFAANIELGKYVAVPKDYQAASALLDFKTDGTATATITAENLLVNCAGSFAVDGNTLSSHVNCDHPQVPEVNMSVDMSNVTPENVRSEEGVEVPAKFDLMGDDPILFILKKAD